METEIENVSVGYSRNWIRPLFVFSRYQGFITPMARSNFEMWLSIKYGKSGVDLTSKSLPSLFLPPLTFNLKLINLPCLSTN